MNQDRPPSEAAQERFDLLAKMTPHVVRDWDFVLDTLWWNDRLQTNFGYSQESGATTPAFWFDHIHPDDRDRVRAHVSQVIEGPNDDWFDHYRLIRADGSYVPVEERGLFQRQQGKAVRLLSTLQVTHSYPIDTDNNSLIQSIIDTSLVQMSILQAVRNKEGQIEDFRIRLVNQELKKATGRTDLVGQLYVQSYPGVRVVGLFDLMIRVMETGETGQMDYYYNHDGFNRWFSCTFVKMNDGLVVTNLDITERKQAQVQMQKNLTLLQETEELAATGSWEYDRTTSQFTWSGGMYRLFDLSPDTPVTPDTYLDYAIEADRPVARRIQNYIRKGVDAFEELIRIRREKTVRTLKVKGVVVPGEEGQPPRALGVDWDITEQVQAARQLETSAQNLQAVLDASPAAIAFLKTHRNQQNGTEDLCLAVCNQKFAALAGRPASQLINHSAATLSPLLWGANTLNRLRHVRDTGQSYYEERYMEGGDGQWLALSVTKQDDGVVVTSLEITDFKQIQGQEQYWLDQLEQASQSVQDLAQLRASLRERAELLRATSHDLRGYVGVIGSAAQLLSVVNTDAERAQMLQMIQRNTRQMTQLMSSLLDYARLEAGQQTRNLAQFDVGELLHDLGEEVVPMVRQQGLRVSTDGPEVLWTEGDKVNVRRITQNLLLNAIKYTAHGEVQLSWGEDKTSGRWWLMVSDTGPGLSPHLLAHLKRFSSLSEPARPTSVQSAAAVEPRQAITRGEGIGLRIVQELVDLLEARLEVSSQPNEGTQFKISFPLWYN